MNNEEQLIELFKIAGKTHHAVYRKEDGADDDWPLWYAQWLLEHTEFPDLIDQSMTVSELTAWFIQIDEEYRAANASEHWSEYYAADLLSK